MLNYDQIVEAEFRRLEAQASLPAYDFRADLAEVRLPPGGGALDAGCGTGALSRYLASRFPQAAIVACDTSGVRLAKAREVAIAYRGIQFEEQDLGSLRYADATFDFVLMRFVAQYQPADGLHRTLAEMLRVLKPGGLLLAIEADGIVLNLHPRTPLVQEWLALLETDDTLDLRTGRKLPQMLAAAGAAAIEWTVRTVEFRDEDKEAEQSLMRARFNQFRPFLEKQLGGRERYDRFVVEYLDCLRDSHAVAFYDKVVVRARK